MIYSLKQKNEFKKGVFVLGELVWVYEYTRYGGKQNKICRLYEIIEVVDKKYYNMYVCRCKHYKRKTRITITDQDYFCKNVYKFLELEVDECERK